MDTINKSQGSPVKYVIPRYVRQDRAHRHFVATLLVVVAALLPLAQVPAGVSTLDPESSDVPTTAEAITARKELLEKFMREFELVPTPAATEHAKGYDTAYCHGLLKAFKSQKGIDHKLPLVSVRGLSDPKLRDHLPTCRETSGYYDPHGGYVATPFYKLWRIEGSRGETGKQSDYLLLEESFFNVHHFDVERTVGAAKYLQVDPKNCGVRDLHLTVREYVPPPPHDLPVEIKREPNLSLHGVVDYKGETLLYRLMTVPLLPNRISGVRDQISDRLIVYRFNATGPVAACMYRVRPE